MDPAPDSKSAPKSDPFELLFVGTRGYLVALNKFTGKEKWRTSLPGTGWSVVALLVEAGVLYAASRGHVFALDPATGELFWENSLPGLGSSHVCVATMRQALDAGANPIAQIAESDDSRRRHSS